MSLLSQRQQLIVAALLTLLMVMTRGHHFADINVLPSASWAVFMLAGFYLASKLWFPAFLGLAAVLDLMSVYIGGASNFCVSPAYGLVSVGRWPGKGRAPAWVSLRRLIPLNFRHRSAVLSSDYTDCIQNPIIIFNGQAEICRPIPPAPNQQGAGTCHLQTFHLTHSRSAQTPPS